MATKKKKSAPVKASAPVKITAVAVQPKKCKPFVLQVAVINPEADFKFELLVEKQCSPTSDSIWKLVFDLYKKNPQGEFVQIVHVSFTAGNPTQSTGIANTAANGVKEEQLAAANQVHKAAKKVAAGTATPADKKAVQDGMVEIAVLGN